MKKKEKEENLVSEEHLLDEDERLLVVEGAQHFPYVHRLRVESRSFPSGPSTISGPERKIKNVRILSGNPDKLLRN